MAESTSAMDDVTNRIIKAKTKEKDDDCETLKQKTTWCIVGCGKDSRKLFRLSELYHRTSNDGNNCIECSMAWLEKQKAMNSLHKTCVRIRVYNEENDVTDYDYVGFVENTFASKHDAENYLKNPTLGRGNRQTKLNCKYMVTPLSVRDENKKKTNMTIKTIEQKKKAKTEKKIRDKTATNHAAASEIEFAKSLKDKMWTMKGGSECSTEVVTRKPAPKKNINTGNNPTLESNKQISTDPTTKEKSKESPTAFQGTTQHEDINETDEDALDDIIEYIMQTSRSNDECAHSENHPQRSVQIDFAGVNVLRNALIRASLAKTGRTRCYKIMEAIWPNEAKDMAFRTSEKNREIVDIDNAAVATIRKVFLELNKLPNCDITTDNGEVVVLDIKQFKKWISEATRKIRHYRKCKEESKKRDASDLYTTEEYENNQLEDTNERTGCSKNHSPLSRRRRRRRRSNNEDDASSVAKDNS